MVASPSIKIPRFLIVTDEPFSQLVTVNPDLRMERTAKEELIVMEPTGSEGGSYNAELSADLTIWNHKTRLGVVFDCIDFCLPPKTE